MADFYTGLAALATNGFTRLLTRADDRLAGLSTAKAANGLSAIVEGALFCPDEGTFRLICIGRLCAVGNSFVYAGRA